jgi:hypothetical protein
MGALTAALTVGSTILSAGSQIASGIGGRRAARAFEKEGERLAEDAILRGEQDVRSYGFDLSRLLGSQRTAGAAQGIDTTQGSLAQITAQTEAFGAEDIAMIRENAMREAYGLRQGARNQAQNLRANANTAFAGAFGTVLNAGANSWARYNQSGGGKMKVATDKFGGM